MSAGLATFTNNTNLGPAKFDRTVFPNVQRLNFDFARGVLHVDQQAPNRKVDVQFDVASSVSWAASTNAVGLGGVGAFEAGLWQLIISSDKGPGLPVSLTVENVSKAYFDFVRQTFLVEQTTPNAKREYQLDNLTFIVWSIGNQSVTLS